MFSPPGWMGFPLKKDKDSSFGWQDGSHIFQPVIHLTICLLFAPDSIFSVYYFAQFSRSGWEVVCPPYFKDRETDTQRLTQQVLITNTCLINGEAWT